MDLAPMINELEGIDGRIAAAETRLATLKTKRRKKFGAVEEVIRPICLRAIQVYNASPALSLRINASDFKLGFYSLHQTFSLSVRLKYPSDREPDEDFDGDELSHVTEAFRKYIEKEFLEAGILFGFGGLTVPNTYYTK